MAISEEFGNFEIKIWQRWAIETNNLTYGALMPPPLLRPRAIVFQLTN
jgi:hypothetical protein